MALTLNEALGVLNSLPETTSALMSLIEQVSVESTGSVTVLYSGKINDNIHSTDVVEDMLSRGMDVRVINKTAAADLLVSDQFLSKVGNIYGLTLEQMRDPVFSHPAKNWLYDPEKGPWANVSRRFVDATVGEVRLITPGVLDKRVFGETELPALLKNQNITTVDGINRIDLLELVDGDDLTRLKNQIYQSTISLLGASGILSTTNASSISAQSLSEFMALDANTIANGKLTGEQLIKVQDGLKQLDSLQMERFRTASIVVFEATKSVSAKALRILGPLFILASGTIAAVDATAAEESGNAPLAREIRARWVVETTGSEVGAFIGGALGVGLAALFSLSGWGAVMLIAVGSIGGAIYGGKGAINYYEMMSLLSEDQRMDVVVRLEKLFFGSEALTMEYLNSRLNKDNLTFTSIGMITESFKEIITNVNNDLAWRYALLNLNPFVVSGVDYTLHNQNGELDWYGADGKLDKYSEEWVFRRAQFLEILSIYWRTGDDDGVLNSNYGDLVPFLNLGGDIHFLDMETKTDLTVDYLDLGRIPKNEIIFGSSKGDILIGGDNFDYLFGMGGRDILIGGKDDDHLEGGDDDDTLEGGQGIDFLSGGKGNDTYFFEGNFGSDTLIDSDGAGKIIINGITLNQFYKTDADGIVFRDSAENAKFEAVLVRDKNAQGVETQSLLIYEIANRENHILIKDWQSGQLNLEMNDAPAVVRDAALIGNFTGDTNANFFTTQLHLQQQANNHLHINANGGEGRDYVQGFLNGSDQIEDGNGNDFLNAGALVEGVSDANPLQHYLFYSQPNVEGTDIINGGAGDDYIIVSGKQSVVHGGTENDIIHADETLSIKFTDFTKDGTAVTQDQLWQDLQQLLVPSAKKDITTENNTTTIKISSSIFNHDKVANDYVSFTSATGLTAWYLLIESATTSGAYVIDLVYSNTKPVLHKSPTTGEWKQDLTNVIASDNISPLNFNYLTGNQFAFDITTYQDQIGHSLFGDQGNDSIFGSYRSDQILGGDGEDNLIGLDGHDVIDGGKENDTIFGGSGKDTLIGGEGDDTILGNGVANRQNNLPDDDKIYGGAGKDKLYGGDGKDYIDGGVGEDELYGEEGDDTLYGGDDEDKDTLVGGGGRDTIFLGKNDIADAGEGNNIYIIRDFSVSETKIATNSNASAAAPASSSSSSLADVVFTPTVITPSSVSGIINNQGNNTISFVGRQNLNDAYVHSQNGNLYITQGNGQQINIMNGAAGNSVQIQFGNNANEFNAENTPSVTITDDDFLNQQKSNRITNTQQLMLNQMQSKATITAASAGYLVGGIANDTLTAQATGNQLVGGKGDDKFNGGLGNDAYLIRRGDGEDTITEKGGINTLKLGEGITTDKITLHRDALDLLVTIDGSQTVRVVGMFDVNGVMVNEKSVQAIHFYNGTQWAQTELLSKVTNLPVAQNPIFATQGDTTHQYLLTQGNRIITDADGIDKLVLDAGITPDNVTITRNESDLFFTLNNGSVITVKNHFTSRAANTPDAQITFVVDNCKTVG